MENGFSIEFFHDGEDEEGEESPNSQLILRCQNTIESCELCVFNHKMWYGFGESCAVNKTKYKITTSYMTTIPPRNDALQQLIFHSIANGFCDRNSPSCKYKTFLERSMGHKLLILFSFARLP